MRHRLINFLLTIFPDHLRCIWFVHSFVLPWVLEYLLEND